MLEVGTRTGDNWREWRLVSTAGTDVNPARARLLAEVLEICGYKAATNTTAPADRSDDDTAWTERA